jgi:signal transduction histidine kinase
MADQYQIVLAPHLCEDGEAPQVRGDPALMRTMIDNLVRNAVRFSPKGQTILVTASAEGREAVVRVRDYGSGIPEQIIGRIFDRFVQAPDEQRRGRGHGLGLEISQGIAELHGGRIGARNCPPPEGGCEFEVRLPKADNPQLAGEMGMSPNGSVPPR